jgi:hypothetical protein
VETPKQTKQTSAGSGDPASAAKVVAAVSEIEGSIATDKLSAHFRHTDAGWAMDSFEVAGRPLLDGDSLQWVLYSDTGGLYRIGSELSDCADATFAETAIVDWDTLELVESGPARATLRARATVDERSLVMDISADAGDSRLKLRLTGGANIDRTITLRARPAETAGEQSGVLAMGVAGGAVERPLTHLYTPAFWPAVTWFARGPLAVHLSHATGVYGAADGAVEWSVFRNADTEKPCDDVGPGGTDDEDTTLEFTLGYRDPVSSGADELRASLSLSRSMQTVVADRHNGSLNESGHLIRIDGNDVVATAVKPATRGSGLIVHLLRLGNGPSQATIEPGALAWDTITRPDLLERDDQAIGTVTEDGVLVSLDGSLTALRLTDSQRQSAASTK